MCTLFHHGRRRIRCIPHSQFRALESIFLLAHIRRQKSPDTCHGSKGNEAYERVGGRLKLTTRAARRGFQPSSLRRCPRQRGRSEGGEGYSTGVYFRKNSITDSAPRGSSVSVETYGPGRCSNVPVPTLDREDITEKRYHHRALQDLRNRAWLRCKTCIRVADRVSGGVADWPVDAHAYQQRRWPCVRTR